MAVYIAQEIRNESSPDECVGESIVFEKEEDAWSFIRGCEENEYNYYVMCPREVHTEKFE